MSYENEEEMWDEIARSDVKLTTPLLTAARNAGKDWRLAVGYRIEPLSGTWAGESIPEISERYDLDLFDSELADLFEEGFYDI